MKDTSWQPPRFQSKPNVNRQLKKVGHVAAMVSHFEPKKTDDTFDKPNIPTYHTDLFAPSSQLNAEQ